MTRPDTPTVALALQGGGSHGAFTWGVLDRLLQEVDAGHLRFAAISGSSAGGINAALCACGLALGGPQAAREKLRAFWTLLSRRGFWQGNALFFGEPGPFGFNIDGSPAAVLLEMVGLVVSPYDNPFYSDPLGPLIEQVLPARELKLVNENTSPAVFITATDVRTNARVIFSQPDISKDVLRASACLPSDFRTVQVGRRPLWDGGYLGNPALSPLIDFSQDLLLIMVNPLLRDDMPPTTARGILDRLNEITFNASVVLEINAIEAVNRVLAERGDAQESKYKPVRLHLIRNDKFLETLGLVSKSSTSRALLDRLFAAGRETADRWVCAHLSKIGHQSSSDPRHELIEPLLKARGTP